MARLQIHTGLPDVSVDVIVPEFAHSTKARSSTSSEYYSNRSLPVLWLLHGGMGNSADWPRYTQIELFAEEKGIIVVCPSAENGCYVNMVKGDQWDDLINNRLWTTIHGMLPTSDKREDNYVAGLSMGGYGAMKFALSRPERFSFVGSFSGGLEIPQEYAEGRFPFGSADMLGDPAKILGGPNDLYHLADALKSSGKQAPKFYISCGTKDGLYDSSVRFRIKLDSLGFETMWDEGNFNHEWRFWNEQVEKFLNVLPLK